MADPADHTRPSPEALLEAANRERRGALKIFLGAAPGVGKTYAMLEGAQQQRREGVDVVVGIVETHGRQETAALLRDLEVIPRRHVEYRGIEVAEMDIDAILHRRPRLVLVDELAHTNAPGSRHLKRYQDVEELLESGINVWSTLNVQHLESLNDVVERIAGIKVRETLPDGVLRQADEIELVDLPPPELLKRLAEGKVYVPEQAQRAIANFFSPGNLTALREMALRQAAERVDAQMLSYMRTHAIPGPWPTRERILVCIGPDGSGPRVVRAAKRVADRREGPWTASLRRDPSSRRADRSAEGHRGRSVAAGAAAGRRHGGAGRRRHHRRDPGLGADAQRQSDRRRPIEDRRVAAAVDPPADRRSARAQRRLRCAGGGRRRGRNAAARHHRPTRRPCRGSP